jgi:mannose-6-phosphate isomerase-like protein (cupin superfamily)
MSGYSVNIARTALENDYFRQVLYTAPHSQLVVMTLQGGEDIGQERHDDVDQFIRVEAGQGEAVLDGERHALRDGSAIVIPAGTTHNVINTSPNEPLHLSTIYSPPNHPDGTIHRTKQEAIAAERHQHGSRVGAP